MSSSDFMKLSPLQQDREALAALCEVHDNTPDSSPLYMPLAHAAAVLAIRVQDAEKQLQKTGGRT